MYSEEREKFKLVTGYWLLVTGYWLLVTGYWLLVTGYCIIGLLKVQKKSSAFPHQAFYLI
jgi:hypothetical protein